MGRLFLLMAVCAVAQGEPGVVFDFATMLGGSASLLGAAADSNGAIYLVGATSLKEFPDTASVTVASGDRSVFVMKIDRDTRRIAYSFVLRGLFDGFYKSVAVDDRGAVYLLGDGLPAIGPQLASEGNTFLLTINPKGDAIERSTRIGECSLGSGVPVRFDGPGNAVFVRSCRTAALEERNYLFRIGANAASSTAIEQFLMTGLALDSEGSAYISGTTRGQAFRETALNLTADRSASSSADVAVVKVDRAGQTRAAVRFGGSGSDEGGGIDVDGSGNVYIFGTTTALKNDAGEYFSFPVTKDAADTFERSGLFAAKLDASLTQMLWSTYVPARFGTKLRVTGAWLTGRGDFAMATPTHISFIDTEGRRITNEARTSVSSALIAGIGGRALVFAQKDYPVTAGAEAIVAAGTRSGWLASLDLYREDAPVLELDRRELGYGPLPLPHDGTNFEAGVPVNATAGGVRVELLHGELEGNGEELWLPPNAPPKNAPLPALLMINGTFLRTQFLFAAGVRDGLQFLPSLSLISSRPVLERTAFFLPPGATERAVFDSSLGMFAQSPFWQRIFNSVRIESPFAVQRFNFPWLTVEPATGVTPATLRFTVDPAGLRTGLNTVQIRLTPSSSPTSVTFVVPEPEPDPPLPRTPVLILNPTPVQFFSIGPRASSVKTLRLTSVGGEQSFTIESQFPGVSFSPAEGTTPAEVTMTVPPFSSLNNVPSIPFQTRTVHYFTNYNAQVIRSNGGPLDGPTVPSVFSPNSVGWVSVPRFWLPEGIAADAYQFRCGGDPWIVLRTEETSVETQNVFWALYVPRTAAVGECRLELSTPDGTLLGSKTVAILDAVPFLLDPAAFHGDGTRVTPAAGVRPGDWIKVNATGLGLRDTGGERMEARLRPKAFTGTMQLPLDIVMPEDKPGQYEIWIQVPKLGYGDHFVRLYLAGDTPQFVPLRVLRPAE